MTTIHDQGTLLERLAQRSAANAGGPPAATLAESIRASLQRVLESRRGMARAALDYGMPELDRVVDRRTHLIQELCREIAATIERAEPRLERGVTVRAAEGETQSPVVLELLINAVVGGPRRADGDPPRIRMAARIGPEGSVDIRPGN
ncbi:MAG: type VI secretion system baseplate subunit TssE [Planctomycetes bacterium]|nr:type VI secretion system baseplate subunit TssE [Planctomycetota bacterium]